MKQLVFPLCFVLSAGVCLGWSQAPIPQGSPALTHQPAPPIKIKRVVIPPIPADAGKEMYVSYCASCHGEDGKGTGLAAPALSRPVPNLSLLSAYNAGRYPRYRVFTALSKFGESHQAGTKWEMPDWHKAFVSLNPACPMLADLRARNINDYVESLQIPNR